MFKHFFVFVRKCRTHEVFFKFSVCFNNNIISLSFVINDYNNIHLITRAGGCGASPAFFYFPGSSIGKLF